MPALIQAKNLNLHQSSKIIFEDLNFEITTHDRIGVVGRNGAGKSSLLRVLAREQGLDFGELTFSRGTTVSYLKQDSNLDNTTVGDFFERILLETNAKIKQYENTGDSQLLEELQQQDAWNISSRLAELKELFNTPPETQYINICSGGQLRRLDLVLTLLPNSSLLILDEPTNHLDLDVIFKLETYLKTYPGAVLIVSHDRTFLNNCVKIMWELDRGRIYIHDGGYDDYLQSKAARLMNEETIEWKKQQYLKRELTWVNAGVQARGTKDKGRLKRYYDLKNEDYQSEQNLDILMPEATRLGARILDLEKVNLRLQSKYLVRNFSFSFQPWHRIGIVGGNGTGKTTFLKLLQQKLFEPDFELTGTVKIGQNTEFLYLDQHKISLNQETNAFEFLSEGKERFAFGTGDIGTRKYLESWLFDREKYMTPIKFLSGGEKSRLTLLKNLTQPNNFLILDEPTNDLDLDTVRVLEEALSSFAGPVIVVSHDRYFLNRVCNNIFGFDGSGNIKVVTGNYDDFEQGDTITDPFQIPTTPIKPASNNLKENRQRAAKVRELEKTITQKEKQLEKIKDKFNDPKVYQDTKKVKDLDFESKLIEKSIEVLIREWENLLAQE